LRQRPLESVELHPVHRRSGIIRAGEMAHAEDDVKSKETPLGFLHENREFIRRQAQSVHACVDVDRAIERALLRTRGLRP